MQQLGCLVLQSPLARGGSAQVWSALHVHTQHPLAVKFLRSDRRALAPMISREAHALASLDHRHIATIYDLAVLEQPLRLSSSEQLEAGTPYLVMELASEGSALPLCGALSEPELLSLLDQTLGALAHIHAHELLHLDIKPSNVLLTAHELLSFAEVRVVDMGLGSIFDAQGAQGAGTPGYMAPEQLRRGELGPWTDLYSLGLMAAQLLLGEALLAHGEPCSEQALERLPQAWRAWIATCLEPEPAARWRSAQLARQRLRAALPFEPSPLKITARSSAQVRHAQTLNSQNYSTQVSFGPLSLPAAGIAAPPAHAGAWTTASSSSDAHVTAGASVGWRDSWQLPYASKPLYRLAELGTGVFMQRAFRMVWRADERDLLWAQLGRSEQEQRVQVLGMVAAQGVGSSALGRWFGHRATELLDARFIQAVELGGERAVDAMLRLMRAIAKPLRAVSEPHRDALEALDVLERGVALGSSSSRAWVELDQVVALCARLIRCVCQEQRLVIFIDDASSAPALVRLARALQMQEIPCDYAAMILVNGRAVAELDGVEVALEVEPMPQEALAALINQAIGLDPVLIDELASRAQGSPKLVTATIQQWLRQGYLEPGPRGLQLTSWRAPWLEESSLEDGARLEQLMKSLDVDARRAFALLCLKGRSVERDWLERALTHAALSWPVELLEQLLLMGVLRQDRRGFVFSSASLLTRSAQLLESMQQVELAASFDRALGEAALAAMSWRRAQGASSPRSTSMCLWDANVWAMCHQVEAALEALEPLLVSGVDLELAGACLEVIERIGALPEARSSSLLAAQLLRARCLYALGDHGADAILAELGDSLEQAPPLLRYAHDEMLLIAALGRGDFAAAKIAAETLKETLKSQRDATLIASANASLARYGIHTKRYDDAISHALIALEQCLRLENPSLELVVRNILGIAMFEHERLDEAITNLEVALRLARALGAVKFQVMAINSLGDVSMRQQRWEEAQRWFELGLDVGNERYPLAAYLRGNLAWIALNQGDPARALGQVDEALSRLSQEPNIVRLYLMELRQGALALLDEAASWDVCMDGIDALMERVNAAHEEGIVAAQWAAARWQARGDEARLERAVALKARLREVWSAHA